VKIAVCLKRVPDTTTKIVIASDGKSIDENGVKFVPNPYDEFAIEAALQLKEASGSGETVVVALGGDSAQETIRTALAVGIDRGVLLQSGGSPDGLEVARALAAELGSGGYDLILFGKLAVDDYNHQVGVMTAELLGLPCITAVAHLKVADGAVEAEREIEGGLEVSTCRLPAVLTCDKGLNTPRLPALKGIMAAKKKPMEAKKLADYGVAPAPSIKELTVTLPPPRPPGQIVADIPTLVKKLAEEAKVL